MVAPMVHAHPRLESARARLLAVSSIDAVVSVLRETAREIAGSDGISVVLRDGAFCHYVAEDAIRPLWRGQRFRLEDCISGWVMLHGRPAVVPDIECDSRLPVAAYRACAMCSLVMVPIGSPVPVAALGAYWSAWVDPDADTVRRLQALADMATVALTRSQPTRQDPALGAAPAPDTLSPPGLPEAASLGP
ncbi:GAF domain-containing protein [Methylobacterium planeticum]|uniref:GAF domain-containing protein n=1 Tax=Methylobacterium planeticum TaxID=2615211 RepID=A0A6N6MKS5_9HYPH|nr:GAF domain-containing protein [Methylobacterium planeticum]KAB1070819.1 GAF domain-containing protein [Methylobacterium planeticum]